MNSKTAANSKKKLTREQAGQIYDQLRKSMERFSERDIMESKLEPRIKAALLKKMKAGPAAPAANDGLRGASPRVQHGGGFARTAVMSRQSGGRAGHYTAVVLVLLFASAKVAFSALESVGFASVSPVLASVAGGAGLAGGSISAPAAPQFSREEVAILTSLDGRRAELEERAKRLEERERELDQRDREFVTRNTQLREMTETLRADRERNDKKKNTQLDQLSNVYGSMDPKEAASLIEQLDVTIALSLLERMPEKRIGQILAMMNPERALTITKMLSGKGV